MNEILGLIIGCGIIFISFTILPLPFSRTGGYCELAKAFKSQRPKFTSALYETIQVERGYGFRGQFTGVNFYFDATGFYIFPMFKIWSLFMPTLFLPYDKLKIEKTLKAGVFSKIKISFCEKSLPDIFISKKHYKNIEHANKKI